MKLLLCILLGALGCTTLEVKAAGDLILLSEGKSDYQIVLPDEAPSLVVQQCLQQVARYFQAAFRTNGAEVPVVTETERDVSKPAIFLGNTRFARQQGINASELNQWTYVHRVIESNVLIAGRDEVTPLPEAFRGKGGDLFDRIGTAKAAADFLRERMGVRFLYPEVPLRSNLNAGLKADLLATPSLEFLKLKTITVPPGLQVRKTPVLEANTAYPPSSSFYDLALNRFPRVDAPFGGHTWAAAVPPETYFKSHPEYFALVGGRRLSAEDGNAQYCLSNPDVQELIYRHMATQFDAGASVLDLGQPDGFRECQCENCEKLFNTGKDWSEKIWLFNRHTAERLQRSHPKGRVMMMSYILTANPPKSFKRFPENTCVMLSGTNEEDIAAWKDCEVPAGFSGYIYNSCPNLGTRYTPMRTPTFVEAQARRLVRNNIRSIYRDGNGMLFGLEGPVYYTMGRMFDDPEGSSAQALVNEFCDAAFGRASSHMRAFYERLYDAINLYSDHIGTRCDAWTYHSYDGRRRKTVTDPFQLIGFLYTPAVLHSLHSELSLAERAADSPRVNARLALVRSEFDYVRHLAGVVHLYHSFQLVPDAPSRERLLDAIDARNAFIESLYTDKGRSAVAAGWPYVLFPLPGHNAAHLRLAHDGYQEPYSTTCLNWDTAAMRAAPLPGKKSLRVVRTAAPLELDSAYWQSVTAHELTAMSPMVGLPRKSVLRLAFDSEHLYARLEAELEKDAPADFPAFKRDKDLRQEEAFDAYLAPFAGREVFYRFMAGANAKNQYDAAAGLITDAMDPRHGKDDADWNGIWRHDSRIDAKTHTWTAQITIPFKTLSAESPVSGAVWRANFARYHLLKPGKVDRSLWSSNIGGGGMEDRTIFGEMLFE